MNCSRDKKLVMPFKFYKPIDAKLIMARIFSLDKHGVNKTFSWHQMSLQFEMEDLVTKERSQKVNVFERREVEGTEGFWRICY